MSEKCGVCTDDNITLMILPYLKVITNEGTKHLLLILTVCESIIIPIKTVLKIYLFVGTKLIWKSSSICQPFFECSLYTKVTMSQYLHSSILQSCGKGGYTKKL